MSPTFNYRPLLGYNMPVILLMIHPSYYFFSRLFVSLAAPCENLCSFAIAVFSYRTLSFTFPLDHSFICFRSVLNIIFSMIQFLPPYLKLNPLLSPCFLFLSPSVFFVALTTIKKTTFLPVHLIDTDTTRICLHKGKNFVFPSLLYR